MRVWRMSLRRTESAIIAWDGSYLTVITKYPPFLFHGSESSRSSTESLLTITTNSCSDVTTNLDSEVVITEDLVREEEKWEKEGEKEEEEELKKRQQVSENLRPYHKNLETQRIPVSKFGHTKTKKFGFTIQLGIQKIKKEWQIWTLI